MAKANGFQTISKDNNEENPKNAGELDNSKRSDRNQDATLQLQKPVEQPVTGQTASQEEVTILKEELEKLKEKIAGELGKQISDLEENVRSLKLTESKEVEICRSEVTFTFELKGVDALLDGSTKWFESELFYCRGGFEFGC